MHLLKITFSLILISLFASCKPAGSLTAEEALVKFQSHFKDIDTANLMIILPQEDKFKLKETLNLINEMDERTRNSFAKNYEINPDRIKNLTEEEYLYILINVIKNKNPELFRGITESSILSMDENENSANIILTSKIKINLKKSGPYWKVHLPVL